MRYGEPLGSRRRYSSSIGAGGGFTVSRSRALICSMATGSTLEPSDGGGKAAAAIRPLHGAERIARLYWALARRLRLLALRVELRIGSVNGEPALLRFHDGRLHSISTIATDGERITQVLSVVNPDKLHAHH